MIQIRAADSPEHVELARGLFRAYASALDFALDFQDFDAELLGLPGAYAAPGGALLLAMDGPSAVGCVALRPLERGICEMKRLYARPEVRGSGTGRRLAEAAMARARKLGYRRMRLDTVAGMKEANALYARLGFHAIGPYCHNPLPDARFFEIDLLAVVAELSDTIAAPPADVFDVFAPMDLTRIMHGYGPLPAVVAVEQQTGAWDSAGQSRTLRLSDGSSMREELTAVERPAHFAYVLTELTSPLRHLTGTFRGSWQFESAGRGTRARWRYAFEPRSLLTRPLTGLVIRWLWRPYMARALQRAREIAESERSG